MSKKEYDINYQKSNCKRISLLLHNEKDKDIIMFLSAQRNVNGLIKALLRKEISNKK